ncbi:universal stress protein [Telmatospirillum sp. J64-1]|uniref:universal stress protein n=1 Tax=Telmatospirillum sp. J64-1 TaxID=2502183 RepID=UPI00115D55BF|nr:universal stress protein [Telmatospirillum sp. J64-1]
MTTPPSSDLPHAFHRIVVAVDASPLSLMALEASAALAQRSHAELTALFIEDVNLLRLASYPEAYSYSLTTAQRRSLEADVVAQAMKLQQAAARRALDDAARRFGLTARFEARRGLIAPEMIQASAACDLLVAGWSGRPGLPLGRRARLGTVARALLGKAAAPVFLLRHSLRSHDPVLVAYDGSAAARRALDLAAALAAQSDGDLEILIPAADPASADELEHQARAILAALGLPATSQRFTATDLAAPCRRYDHSLLVAPLDLLPPAEDLPCSVVAVR